MINSAIYLKHLLELRRCLIRCSLLLLILFLVLFIIDEKLYEYIAIPLLKNLPQGAMIIATEVTSPFMIPMKLAFILAVLLAIPFILYQIWLFVAPGLYPTEKTKILPLLFMSTILFYLGVFFAYFFICPVTLSFFAQAAPKGVSVMTDIRCYLDFVTTLLFSGGIAFQVPVITLALIKSKLLSIEKCNHLRPYIIVLAFIVGMLLTPPDVISQVLLALPMWGLFELGLIIAKLQNFNNNSSEITEQLTKIK